MRRSLRSLPRIGAVCGAATLSLLVGIGWHEFVGHGLVGKLCGGTIEYLDVLGLEIYPQIQWVGWPLGFFFGHCSVAGLSSDTSEHLMSLGGSLSTWCVAAIATGVMLMWKRVGWSLVAPALLSLWWIDALSYTLPVWGIRKAILWGSDYPEPYMAAVALGCPGWLYLIVVVASSVLMGAALVAKIAWGKRGVKSVLHEEHRGEDAH